MPRPFPVPLNIGTDICSIPRVLKILKGRNGRKFIRRVLSEQERKEGIERLDGPVERWMVADRMRSVLEWKRKELGLGIQELARRRACGKESVKERGGLNRELERGFRAEENVARTREGVDSKDKAEPMEWGLHKKSNEVVAAEDKVEVTSNEAPADLKQRGLDDANIMIGFMEENEKELQAAEEALKKAAEFMAGRFAAKEAAIKAHHNRKLKYHSIAIHRPPDTNSENGSRPPIAVILPETGEWEEGQEVKISISHDADYATAVCMAFESKRRFQAQQLRKEGFVSKPRRIGPGHSGTSEISESNKNIFEELEIDDVEPKAEEDGST